jgi:hypothetical protein
MNNELTASIEVKPEGETTKVANVHGSHAYQPHQG